MASILEKTLLMGLGVFTLTREKVREAVNELIEQEGVEPEEADKLADALVKKGEKEREELRDMISQEVRRVTPVSRKEFEALIHRVDELGEELHQGAESE